MDPTRAPDPQSLPVPSSPLPHPVQGDGGRDPGPSGAAAEGAGWPWGAALVAGAALAAAAVPLLPLVLLVPVWLALGLAVAAPQAASWAAHRGHALKTRTAQHPLTPLQRGGPLRVALCGAVGIVAAGVLLVRLAAGGAPAWLGAAAAVAAVLAVVLGARGAMARFYADAHGEAKLRWKALGAGTGAMVVASGLAGWWLGPGDPELVRPAATALVAEAFAAHRLWLGVEAWALAGVAALAVLPPWLEALLVVLLTAVGGGAVAALAVAALMPAWDWLRAVAPSSDAPVPPPPRRAALQTGGALGAGAPASDAPVPPPPRRAALLTGGALAVAVAGGALWAEHRLSAQAPEARPVAQLQTTVERIGTAFHLPGTHARIDAGRAGLAALEADALAELHALVEAGFDAMGAGVEAFLDEYYSLRGEYWRIGVAAGGLWRGDAEAALEAHLAARLAAALDGDGHLRPVADRLASLGLALAEARAAQQAREELLLGAPVVADVNPARLRVAASFPGFAPLPELRVPGLTTTLEARLAGSAAAGMLGAAVARQVLARLMRQGILRLGARALLAAVPLAGTLIAVATDAAALALEEHLNRAAFEADILAALDEQRAAVLSVLVAPEARGESTRMPEARGESADAPEAR